MKNAEKTFYAVVSTFRITLILAPCAHIPLMFWKKGKKNLVRQILVFLSVCLLLHTGILNSASLGSEESKKIKQDVYNYDLTQYCMLVLRQDHSRLRGGWATAAQLAEILR